MTKKFWCVFLPRSVVTVIVFSLWLCSGCLAADGSTASRRTLSAKLHSLTPITEAFINWVLWRRGNGVQGLIQVVYSSYNAHSMSTICNENFWSLTQIFAGAIATSLNFSLLENFVPKICDWKSPILREFWGKIEILSTCNLLYRTIATSCFCPTFLADDAAGCVGRSLDAGLDSVHSCADLHKYSHGLPNK